MRQKNKLFVFDLDLLLLKVKIAVVVASYHSYLLPSLLAVGGLLPPLIKMVNLSNYSGLIFFNISLSFFPSDFDMETFFSLLMWILPSNLGWGF